MSMRTPSFDWPLGSQWPMGAVVFKSEKITPETKDDRRSFDRLAKVALNSSGFVGWLAAPLLI